VFSAFFKYARADLDSSEYRDYNLSNHTMSRVKKAVLKILEGRSDANFAFDELCHVVERAGFIRRSGKGSHTIFYKEGVDEIINLQPRGAKAKPYQVKQVREILLKYQFDFD